jgi:hypothetical protein
MKAPWWIAEMQMAAARKTWSSEQRRAANIACAVGVVLLACIMVPVDLALYRIGLGDVLAGGISAAIATVLGFTLSHLICGRIWPILREPR